jgi:phosphoglycolate phosphatase
MNLLEPYLKDKSHVIWDWNGTLLADVDHAVKTVNVLLKENRLPAVNVEEYKQTFGFPVVDYYYRLGFSRDPAEFLKLCERFNEIFYAGLGDCSLWPGAQQLLSDVKASGKMQSVLSASEHSMLISSLKHFGLSELFDNVYGIFDKTAASKVQRGIQLIESVDIPRADTVLIGDTDHDLEVGEAMGIDVLLVEHGHQCPLRLKAAHHTVLKVL